jgi:hypothetical protein
VKERNGSTVRDLRLWRVVVEFFDLFGCYTASVGSLSSAPGDDFRVAQVIVS